MEAVPQRLADCRVAIIGLGLMGGSLAKALHGRCTHLRGFDPDPDTLQLALDEKTIAGGAITPDSQIADADLIVLAAPVRAIIELVQQLPEWHPGQPIVVDLGSTKREILAAMQALPERFDPIGGHPLCGKEKSSLRFAESGLFNDAPFVLIPLERTSDRARRIVLELVQQIGAYPVWLEAETHDRWVAATSHFPYVLANLLAGITPDEVIPLVGPGLRSTTRLAGSSLTMMIDILATNSEAILDRLRTFDKQLEVFTTALENSDWQTVEALLIIGRDRYQNQIDSSHRNNV